ncbi:MAG: amidase family protein, partial [Actinomycetota bacterium]|nr:amidase family protein [Actinomycetota bacterium]
FNPALNAVVTLDAVAARRRAMEADAALARGEVWGPLHGLPVTLKDAHSTAGMRTTAGYPPLADYVPERDGTVAGLLRGAGAIIMGKTNVSLLMRDIQSDNPVFGRANNPWNLERTPGGSSGGAAAALAAGLTPLDIGSDLAGSIRIPAAFCGVYGLKPTEHRVSLAGHIAAPPGTPRTDRILWATGPLARSVDDLALAFRAIARPVPESPEVPPVSIPNLPRPELSDLRIAWAPAFPGLPVAGAIRSALHGLAADLARRGARVEERLPDLDFAEQDRLRYRLAQTMSAVAQDDEGEPMSLPDYLDALDRRDAYIAEWERLFADWDVLICPATATTAFAHTPTETPVPLDGEPVAYWLNTAYCRPFNFTGHPVVAIPVGLDPDGLPIGVQIVGHRWLDERLLAAAARIAEVAGPFRRPPIAGT